MRDPKEGGSITRWPMKGERLEVGIPSVKSMVLNVVALEALARWWTALNPNPRVIPIQKLRHEVRRIKVSLRNMFGALPNLDGYSLFGWCQGSFETGQIQS